MVVTGLSPLASTAFDKAFAETATPDMAPLVPLFAPYCGGMAQPSGLLQALDRLAQGSWQGVRQLEGGRVHPYRLEWQGESAPLEMLRCQLLFPALPELGYRFTLPAHQLVLWLVQSEGDDLPQAFWRWLLLGQPMAGEA
jgi:hypothetical protein